MYEAPALAVGTVAIGTAPDLAPDWVGRTGLVSKPIETGAVAHIAVV